MRLKTKSAECCSQCLLALFISLASGPSHSQLHLSPLICPCLPPFFLPPLDWGKMILPSFQRHIPRHRGSTYLIHHLHFHNTTGMKQSNLPRAFGTINAASCFFETGCRLLFSHVLLLCTVQPHHTTHNSSGNLSVCKCCLIMSAEVQPFAGDG